MTSCRIRMRYPMEILVAPNIREISELYVMRAA